MYTLKSPLDEPALSTDYVYVLDCVIFLLLDTVKTHIYETLGLNTRLLYGIFLHTNILPLSDGSVVTEYETKYSPRSIDVFYTNSTS